MLRFVDSDEVHSPGRERTHTYKNYLYIINILLIVIPGDRKVTVLQSKKPWKPWWFRDHFEQESSRNDRAIPTRRCSSCLSLCE